jgi:hypothetical protein
VKRVSKTPLPQAGFSCIVSYNVTRALKVALFMGKLRRRCVQKRNDGVDVSSRQYYFSPMKKRRKIFTTQPVTMRVVSMGQINTLIERKRSMESCQKPVVSDQEKKSTRNSIISV